MLDSQRACIIILLCEYVFHGGLPQSLYILLNQSIDQSITQSIDQSEFICVIPWWTPTELRPIYPLVLMCVSMVDSHKACISSCVSLMCVSMPDYHIICKPIMFK